jgi:hypothetical protein
LPSNRSFSELPFLTTIPLFYDPKSRHPHIPGHFTNDSVFVYIKKIVLFLYLFFKQMQWWKQSFHSFQEGYPEQSHGLTSDHVT